MAEDNGDLHDFFATLSNNNEAAGKKMQELHRHWISRQKQEELLQQECTENISASSATIAMLHQRRNDMQQDSDQLSGVLQTMEHQLQQLVRQREDKENELNDAQNELTNIQEKVQHQQKILDGINGEKLGGPDNMASRVALFEKYLALRVEVEEGGTTFCFSQVKKDEPELEYRLGIAVRDGVYECQASPALTELEGLVQSLNANNNLLGFIVAVRKRFQDLS